MRHTLVVSIRTRQRASLVVERNIERLGVCSELHLLQVAPFVAYGAESAFFPVYGHFFRFRQARLVVYVQGDEHIVFVEQFADFRIYPN